VSLEYGSAGGVLGVSVLKRLRPSPHFPQGPQPPDDLEEAAHLQRIPVSERGSRISRSPLIQRSHFPATHPLRGFDAHPLEASTHALRAFGAGRSNEEIDVVPSEFGSRPLAKAPEAMFVDATRIGPQRGLNQPEQPSHEAQKLSDHR